jgi:RHS repeat-associated protein
MAFAENSFAEQGKQPRKYNGKELDRMHGLNLYDYSARQMEPALGRFTTVDPMCEKYYEWSPYAYAGNNPMKYVDPDGRRIKIANNAEQALANLAKIAVTFRGSAVLDRLINSKQTYSVKGVFFSSSSTYDDVENTVNYVKSPWINNVDGGSISSELAMGHELYHAYQDDLFMIQHYNGEMKGRKNLEEGAVGFTNYLRQSWGQLPLRNTYKSMAAKYGRFNPQYFSAEAKYENFHSLGNNKDETSHGYSYNTTIYQDGGKKTATKYIIVTKDKDKTFTYRIYDNEDAYKRATEGW